MTTDTPTVPPPPTTTEAQDHRPAGPEEPEERPEPSPSVTPLYPPPPEPPPAAASGRRRWVTPVATVVVAAVVAAATSAVTTAALTGDEATDPTATIQVAEAPAAAAPPAADVPAGDSLTVSQIADAVGPSVAAVHVRTGRGGGQGSAVILDPDGLLVTNNHVVENATAIEVQLANGSRSRAELVGTDPATDLAVLRIDATGLPAATFAAELPSIGETAVAIGSPFGLDGSVSAGIVSALDRTIGTGANTLAGLIQTDAAINPGNSGGALVDDRGRVIGINTAIISRSGTNGGVGFAVPAVTVTEVAEQLVATGQVRRAVLGVSGVDIDPQTAAAYRLDPDAGALIVAVVPGSGAAEAGIQAGDIVTSVDGTAVTSMSDLAETVRGLEPGAVVSVEALRDGEPFRAEVQLGQG